MTRWVQRESFEIRTEDDRRFRVLVMQEMLDVSSQDRDAELPGDVVLRTEDGLAVNDRGDGTYEIVQLGLLARRVG